MGMINISRKKKIYNKLFCINIDNTPAFFIDNLNVIVSCGVFLEGHVSFKMIDKIMNLLDERWEVFFYNTIKFF